VLDSAVAGQDMELATFSLSQLHEKKPQNIQGPDSQRIISATYDRRNLWQISDKLAISAIYKGSYDKLMNS